MAKRISWQEQRRPVLTKGMDNRNVSRQVNIRLNNVTFDSPNSPPSEEGKVVEEKERNWHGCREDISPSEPIPEVSIKEVLPSLLAQMMDQIAPSYRETARVVANVSAEQNLRQMKEWNAPPCRVKMTTAASMVASVMELKKKISVI
ncbi:hypothetical protein ACOMHN_059311 [Nucella lapillus]